MFTPSTQAYAVPLRRGKPQFYGARPAAILDANEDGTVTVGGHRTRFDAHDGMQISERPTHRLMEATDDVCHEVRRAIKARLRSEEKAA